MAVLIPAAIYLSSVAFPDGNQVRKMEDLQEAVQSSLNNTEYVRDLIDPDQDGVVGPLDVKGGVALEGALAIKSSVGQTLSQLKEDGRVILTGEVRAISKRGIDLQYNPAAGVEKSFSSYSLNVDSGLHTAALTIEVPFKGFKLTRVYLYSQISSFITGVPIQWRCRYFDETSYLSTPIGGWNLGTGPAGSVYLSEYVLPTPLEVGGKSVIFEVQLDGSDATDIRVYSVGIEGYPTEI